MNDPLNVLHEHENEKVQAALRAQQQKDVDAGNCVQQPDGYRLATKEERVECIAFAKLLARTGQWTGKIEAKEYEFLVLENGQPKLIQVPVMEDGKQKVGEDEKPIFESKIATQKLQGRDAVLTFGHWWIKDEASEKPKPTATTRRKSK